MENSNKYATPGSEAMSNANSITSENLMLSDTMHKAQKESHFKPKLMIRDETHYRKNNPLDSHFDFKSNTILPEILSPSRRNEAAAKQRKLTGYSRKKMVLNRHHLDL
jgi:hypothetical protein